MERAWVAWSGGKDAAWALYGLREGGEVKVAGLLTTLTDPFDRVSMHAIRREVLRAQAREVGLPLHEMRIPHPCPNEAYERAARSALQAARAAGVRYVAYGDLFLEDVRAYREEMMRASGVEPLFPLWGLDTRTLAETMLEAGVEARLTCLDPRALPPAWAGRSWDRALLAELPTDVDPCGENGEFHTCVTAGPFFRRPIGVVPGEVVRRDGFVFRDLAPSGQG